MLTMLMSMCPVRPGSVSLLTAGNTNTTPPAPEMAVSHGLAGWLCCIDSSLAEISLQYNLQYTHTELRILQWREIE